VVTLHSNLDAPIEGALDWPSLTAVDACETYDRWADTYDALYGDLDVDAQFYLASAKTYLPAAEKLLEIGVGTGRLTAHLLLGGHRVVGLDTSGRMLQLAAERFRGNDRLELVCGDVRTFHVEGASFPLVIAPYGMVAHLLTDADRLAAFRAIYAHLKPGGVFIFDDCPSWMQPSVATELRVSVGQGDPDGEGSVRLMTNTVEAAAGSLSIRYDFIDRLDRSGRVLKRTVVRIVFRNIALADELELLVRAGFDRVDILGGFDGLPLDMANPAAQTRLVLRCHRAA
jgi:SAM-dependent methyltransferase